jgi:hypothetical protein
MVIFAEYGITREGKVGTPGRHISDEAIPRL